MTQQQCFNCDMRDVIYCKWNAMFIPDLQHEDEDFFEHCDYKTGITMTNKELIKIAYSIGADLNSVGMVVSALQKGIEIGKQETIEDACCILLDMALTEREEYQTYKDVITAFRKKLEE